jgi:hypothetical protein
MWAAGARYSVTPPPYTVTEKLLYIFLTAFSPLNRVIAKSRKVRSRVTRVACIRNAYDIILYTYVYIIYICIVHLLVWITNCTRCTVHKLHKNSTSQFTGSSSEKRRIVRTRFFKQAGDHKSAFTPTSFLCLYHRLPSELHHTALFNIMSLHPLPLSSLGDTHNPFNATAACHAVCMPLRTLWRRYEEPSGVHSEQRSVVGWKF